MVHRGQKDRDDAVPDPTRDRVADEVDDAGNAEDTLAWEEQVAPLRPAPGPVLRRWLRVSPAWLLGVVLLTVATAWPWLILVGWLQRGGPYFWWFVAGVVAVVWLAWLRFLDERVLRAVPGIHGPSVQREDELLAALAAAGAPPATVWLGRVGPDRTLCLATPTRCHVVVPDEPAVDDATLAADAAARLRTADPWLRPLTFLAGGAWLGPFAVAAQLLMRRLGMGSGDVPRRARDGAEPRALERTLVEDPIATSVALLSAGVTGFGVAATVAAARDEAGRLGLSQSSPWAAVAGAAILVGVTWMILFVWPRGWVPIRVDGAHSRGQAPEWRGTNDRREAMRNRAILAGRRGMAQVIGTFGSWFAATMWCTYVPLALMEKFGWLETATHEWRLTYLVLMLPGLALGVYAFRSAYDLQRGNPMVVLFGGAIYAVTTLAAPLVVRGLVAAGAVDETSGTALVLAHVAVVVVVAVGLAALVLWLFHSRRKAGATDRAAVTRG